MRKSTRGSAFYPALACIPLALLLILFMLPLAFNLMKAFIGEDGFSLDLVVDVFTTPYTYRLLGFTLLQAALSSLVSVLVAMPGAYLYANYRFRLKGLMLTLSSLCFVLPSILVVLGFVIFYGNSGFVNAVWQKITGSDDPIRILYSFKAIILAHVYLNFPIAFLLITNAWTELPDTPEKAAYTLGAGRFRTFLTVTLPRLSPSIISAFVLIFLFCFSSFSIILVLGGSPAYSTFETEIYRRVHISVDREGAAALSLFSFFVTGLLLIASSRTRREAKASRRRKELSKAKGRKAVAALLGLARVGI